MQLKHTQRQRYSSSARRRLGVEKRHEGRAELSADGQFDGEIATLLGRPKASLRKHSDEGEPRRVVGGNVRRFRIGVRD